MRLYLSTSGLKATVSALRYSISGGEADDAEIVIFCSYYSRTWKQYLVVEQLALEITLA